MRAVHNLLAGMLNFDHLIFRVRAIAEHLDKPGFDEELACASDGKATMPDQPGNSVRRVWHNMIKTTHALTRRIRGTHGRFA